MRGVKRLLALSICAAHDQYWLPSATIYSSRRLPAPWRRRSSGRGSRRRRLILLRPPSLTPSAALERSTSRPASCQGGGALGGVARKLGGGDVAHGITRLRPEAVGSGVGIALSDCAIPLAGRPRARGHGTAHAGEHLWTIHRRVRDDRSSGSARFWKLRLSVQCFSDFRRTQARSACVRHIQWKPQARPGNGENRSRLAGVVWSVRRG